MWDPDIYCNLNLWVGYTKKYSQEQLLKLTCEMFNNYAVHLKLMLYVNCSLKINKIKLGTVKSLYLPDQVFS